MRQLTTDLNGVMRSLHLPEAIEATAGTGVPNSVIQKAAEIRTKGGMDRINQMSAANPDCLQRNREILEEGIRKISSSQN